MRGGAVPKVRAKRSENERQAIGSELGYQPPTNAASRPIDGEIPGAGAQQLHLRRIEPRIGDDRADLRQRFLPARQEQRVDRARRSRRRP